MSGAKIADELEKTPTAFNFLNPNQALPVGAKYTNIKSQQPTALRQHTSAGLLSADAVEPELKSFSDLVGRNVMSIVGDQTDRKTVTHVNDLRLPEPVKSMAGFRYMDVPNQGYAGATEATSSKLNEAIKRKDPYMMSVMMGEVSGDFAQHQGDVYGQMWKRLTAIAQRLLCFLPRKHLFLSVPHPRSRTVGGSTFWPHPKATGPVPAPTSSLLGSTFVAPLNIKAGRAHKRAEYRAEYRAE